MPNMDGFETCRRLKAIEGTKNIPVIFMTALTDIENKITGFDVGGVDYVSKPPNMQCTAYSAICGVQEYAESPAWEPYAPRHVGSHRSAYSSPSQ